MCQEDFSIKQKVNGSVQFISFIGNVNLYICHAEFDTQIPEFDTQNSEFDTQIPEFDP